MSIEPATGQANGVERPMGEPSLREWLDGVEPPDVEGDATPATEPARRGRRRLWQAAGLAWAVVAGVALVALRAPAPPVDPVPGGAAVPGVEPTGAPARAATGTQQQAGQAVPPTVPVPSPETAPAAALGAHQGREASVTAAAAVAVRLALTARAPDGSARYVDLAQPSSVAWHGEVAVVTVDAVVLDGDEGGWQPPRAARYAQAVLVEPGLGVRPLGQPWALPPPPEAEPPVLEPVDDPEAVAGAETSLVEAGYADVEVTAVARLSHAAGVLVVTADARAPQEESAGTHHVWLAAGQAGAAQQAGAAGQAGPAGPVLGHPPVTGATAPPREEQR